MYEQEQDYTLHKLNKDKLHNKIDLPVDKFELSLTKPICSAGLHFSVMITKAEVSMKAKPNGAVAQGIYLTPFLLVHFVYQS
jgi:hypothetical protein